MASEEGAQASNEEDEEIPTEFECSICMKLMLDPVTVSCGHTFCRICLQKSLGYRGMCAVCRAPIADGQGVNILVRGIISERFPRALARRHRENDEELRATETAADEARRREANGAPAAGAAPGAGAGGAREAAALPVLPLLGGLDFGGAVLLPHAVAEVELRNEVEERLMTHALQGSRRIGAVDGALRGTFDDGARPFGVCLEIQNIRRGNTQRPTTVRLTGKFRFWLVEPPQMHDDGFHLGRCEAFFDEALPTADLAGSLGEPQAAAAEEQAAPAPSPTSEVARAALMLLEEQFRHVGHGGRHMFEEHFGDVPAPPPLGQPTTSAAMERLSFFLLAALLTDSAERRRWLGSVDTRGRLEHCRGRLETAGRRPVLNLPGAGSWMSPSQSAFGSFALLIGIIALFVAKALGIFEHGGLKGLFHSNENSMEEAMAFGQLLR